MSASRYAKRGLTLVEVLIVVSILGIVGSIAVSRISLIHQKAEQTKLEQDVKSINSAVKIYLANGGSFEGITSPQEVLDRMKAGLSGAAQDRFVGISGATIDKRLATRSDASPSGKVAVWSPDQTRFIIVENLGTGISGFYLDESLQMKTYEMTASRQSILEYSDSPGWIWEFEEGIAPVGNAPTVVATYEMEDSIPPPIPRRLTPPLFSTAAGPYLETEYPLPIILSNPNDPATWIMVSVNGEPFVRYESPITLPGPGTVVAFASGDPTYWISSDDRAGTYTQSPPAPPIPLIPPLIDLSAPQFTDSVSAITVTLTNPNLSGSSSVLYSIVPKGQAHPAPAAWKVTSGSLSTRVTDYPDGFDLIAYARSTDTDRYLDSTSSTAFTTTEFYNLPITGNVLFVVDASSSMGRRFGKTTRFEATIEELLTSIQRLPSHIKFNVALFDKAIHWTDGTFKLHNATPPIKKRLSAKIETLDHGSGTNYAAALELPTLFDPRPDQVILLSDGRPNSNNYSGFVSDLSNSGVRVDAIAFDLDDASSQVLEAIAVATGGRVESVDETSP
ncbi:MAG: VWA domain-containing protein [Verrucomicrobiales bacterium]|nr:VWA domain-containing protein [Verrucomicrobiales bacterium]